MLMRPVRRMGRPGLLGTAARTAVVAGTATAVVGGMSRHQQQKASQAAEAQAYEQQQQQQQAMANQAAAPPAAPQAPPPPPLPAPAPAPAPAGSDDVLSQLERLAKLKDEGILTDAEFQAEKSKILGL